jgi:cell division protein FtsA
MHFGLIKDVTANNERLVVGLEVGTTKVCAMVAEVTGAFKKSTPGGIKIDDINIIGVGKASSRGIRKGVVTNIEETVESIREAVEEAEQTAGIHIRAVHIGVTGSHIDCLASNGVIAVKEKEIGQREVDSVIDAAKAVALPFDRDILHVVPVGFTVDGQNGITDPRGMEGVRLEGDVQIITCSATSVRNLIKSCQKAGLEVIDVALQPLACAEAVLAEDEKNLGSAVIDVGGGTTDIAVFLNGNICHSSVLAIGGNNFTNDIALGLRIPTYEAEEIKKKYGCSMLSLLKDNEGTADENEAGRKGTGLPREYIVEILQPRAEELFSLVKEEIAGKGFHPYMNSGVVLTGGAVLMDGLDVMAENILELPVRIGIPDTGSALSRSLCDPAYAASIGLALYGARDTASEQWTENPAPLNGIRSRMRGWFGDAFKLLSS